MKPVSRMNPATDENREQDRNNTNNINNPDIDSNRESSRPSARQTDAKAQPASLSERKERSSSNNGGSQSGVDSKSEILGFDSEAIGSAINQFAGRAQEVATDVMGKAQDYGSKAVDQSGEFIKRYPTQTLLAGFGVGLVLGLTLGRR